LSFLTLFIFTLCLARAAFSFASSSFSSFLSWMMISGPA